jgi:hypothetical protein
MDAEIFSTLKTEEKELFEEIYLDKVSKFRGCSQRTYFGGSPLSSVEAHTIFYLIQ